MKNKFKISSFSAIVTFVALAILGLGLIPKLAVKLAPSEALPTINVAFSMPGSPARIVETEATSRIEGALSRISGVKGVRSRSSNGYGNVTVELDHNANMEYARFEVAMAVRQLWNNLPHNVTYPVISLTRVDDNSARPFMAYTVNAQERPIDIMKYAEEHIRPSLSRIPGVAKVEFSGATPFEWKIVYDNEIVRKLNISPYDITRAIDNYTQSKFLGTVTPTHDDDSNWIRISVRNPAATDSLDISRIFVTSYNGEIITLDKIASVSHIEASPTRFFRINGLNSIYLTITSTDAANQIELSKKIRATLAGMRLPKGYMLDLSYDASERIATELDRIYFRTSLTTLILLIFVAIITLSWRYLLLITISLAINMSVAVVVYYILKVEIQLYSLAGITISLNLVIDNLIVMTEHITRRHNLRAFSAVLAATLTTIGALSVVFILDEKIMLSLKDFIVVIIVNLCVSLFVSLFLVPALIEQIGLNRSANRRRKCRRIPIRILKTYDAGIRFLCRHKKCVYAVFIFGFGLPVFTLPEKIEKETVWANAYNATIGSDLYQKKIKKWIDISLGGTLRLFVENVYNGSYWSRSLEEPVVYISATLPNGATLQQMDALIRKMEAFLTQQEGVRQFQSSIYSARRGSIAVYFKKERQRDGYPYRLKADLVSKALTLGGGGWSVYGLEDQGFSNDVRESAGNYRVQLKGYNYDDLFYLVGILRDTLLQHRRIREVNISSEFSYWKDENTEFFLDLDRKRLALDSLSVYHIYDAIKRDLGLGIEAGTINSNRGAEIIRLSSKSADRDIWGFINYPFEIKGKNVRLSDFATIGKRQTPTDVVKENQEYVLCLQYEYIGSQKQGEKHLKGILEGFNKTLPIGYKAEKADDARYMPDSKQSYLLLGLVAVIIFFVSAILFNSLRLSLAIILVIPVSFIGVFLTFYLFNLKYDQGGFAAFILLCGITVNAAIYIINEYNSLRHNSRQDPMRLYMKAFSIKITAVWLTAISTVLGFIPFLVGDAQESFWYPLAAGTMGGLIFSMTAIYILLPLLVLPSQKESKKISMRMTNC